MSLLLIGVLHALFRYLDLRYAMRSMLRICQLLDVWFGTLIDSIILLTLGCCKSETVRTQLPLQSLVCLTRLQAPPALSVAATRVCMQPRPAMPREGQHTPRGGRTHAHTRTSHHILEGHGLLYVHGWPTPTAGDVAAPAAVPPEAACQVPLPGLGAAACGM